MGGEGNIMGAKKEIICNKCVYSCKGSICKSHMDNCEGCPMYPNVPSDCICNDYVHGVGCPNFKEDKPVEILTEQLGKLTY